MRQTRKNGVIMTLIAVFAILAMGTTAMAAGIGGSTSDLPFFAQNGNGNGNGNGGRSGENPPHRPGTGNNGQGQGVEHGNPPADPGSGNNRQGGPSEDETEGDVAAPVTSEDTDGTDETVETQAEDTDTEAEPVNPVPEKLDVCHVIDKETEDAVLINISSRAVPAHQRHGDTVIGETAESTCGATAEEDAAEAAPVVEEGDDVMESGTPIASPIPGGDEDDDDATEIGTPAASPVASPMASPTTDEDND